MEGGPASRNLPPQDNRGETDSKKPASKSADSKKPAKTATTKATPHNGDKTGCGHSAAHYPRNPRQAWPQDAVWDGHLPSGSAL